MNILVWIGVGLLLAWALNGLLREYLVAKILQLNYQRKLNSILTNPNAKPKGRFE